MAKTKLTNIDKKTWSLTKQMELEMNNPELAEQLRKAAK